MHGQDIFQAAGPAAGPADGAAALHARIAFVNPEARALYGGPPEPATPHSAGVDLRACLAEAEARIPPGGRLAVPSGIRVQPIAPGVAGLVCSRSGLGARDGLVVAQGVGLIDPDYVGEIVVWLLNTSGEERVVRRGDRVAQLVFLPFFRPLWREEEPDRTERGSGGFGHSGLR